MPGDPAGLSGCVATRFASQKAMRIGTEQSARREWSAVAAVFLFNVLHRKTRRCAE